MNPGNNDNDLFWKAIQVCFLTWFSGVVLGALIMAIAMALRSH